MMELDIQTLNLLNSSTNTKVTKAKTATEKELKNKITRQQQPFVKQNK